MEKVKSFKKGIEEVNCYCTDCDWRDYGFNKRDGIKARRAARYHAQKNGHEVDVYTEDRTRIKPINDTHA